MSGRYACALALLLLSNGPVPLCAQELPKSARTDSVIRANVIQVNVGVTVTTARKKFLHGLRQRDFQIFDNGVEQPVASFAPNDGPTQVVLLIESSAQDTLLAKLGKSPFAAANGFLSVLPPSAAVAIVTYSNQARLVLDFTTDRDAARFALQDLHSRLMNLAVRSSHLNLSSSIAATLDWLAPVPGGKTVVVFTTGIDTSPLGSWQTVQEKLETSEARILAVSIFGDFRKLPRNKKSSPDDRENRAFLKESIAKTDEWLRQLSQATGGRSYFPKDEGDFRHAYAEMAQFVAGEYSLAFVPPVLDGRRHAIKVKVRRSWCRVHHRQSYVALSPASD